jgi:hypothetical protein
MDDLRQLRGFAMFDLALTSSEFQIRRKSHGVR